MQFRPTYVTSPTKPPEAMAHRREEGERDYSDEEGSQYVGIAEERGEANLLAESPAHRLHAEQAPVEERVDARPRDLLHHR